MCSVSTDFLGATSGNAVNLEILAWCVISNNVFYVSMLDIRYSFFFLPGC